MLYVVNFGEGAGSFAFVVYSQRARVSQGWYHSTSTALSFSPVVCFFLFASHPLCAPVIAHSDSTQRVSQLYPGATVYNNY
jgi:hypothetical protein